MIVPSFWAEGQSEQKIQGRRTTLRRFGWSDASQADAQAHADQRAQDAMQRLINGEKLIRREPKTAYNGAHGVPIREEIIERHGSTIITRNAYGAQCLNTPNILFADIDFMPRRASLWEVLALIVVRVVVALGVYRLTQGGTVPPWVWVALSLVALQLVFWAFRWGLHRILASPEGIAQQRAEQFVAQHPQWNLRLYRTPLGMRILATHRLFDSAEQDVTRFFEAMQTDPMYAAMCRNQHCFRARLTAKPWRIRMPKNLPPRPRVWPVSAQHIAGRNAWLSTYDQMANQFAACAFVTSLGSGRILLDVQPVVDLHDERCRAHQALPLA